MSKKGLRRKVAALFISTGLLAFSIPVLASPDDSSNNAKTNVKKATQKVDSMIQVTPNKNSNQRSPQVINKGKKFKQGEVIVKFKSGRDIQNLGETKTKHNLKTKQNLNKSNTKLLTFNPKASINQVIKDIKASGQVEFAEPNYARKVAAVSDPMYGELWGLKNTGQSILGIAGKAGIDIGAETAWTKTKGSSSVVVAVTDTGVDINHPDLKDRIWKNTGEVAGDGLDNDNNGYVDDVNGWDFSNKDNTVYDSYDGDEHGTHVSGTIAGTSNTIGVTGVAPNVKIMPLKFLTDTTGYISDEVLAIEYAKAKGVKIVNMSLGGYGYSQAEYDAIKNTTSLIVAAAGNEGNNDDGSDPSYPAGYDLPNILSVAAIDNTGNVPYWSNYGPVSTDIAAPGVDILSTVPGYYGDYSSAYDYYDGTSMATPHVAGAAALVLSRNTSSSAATIKDKLLTTTTTLSSLQGVVKTGGLLNAGKAVGYEPDNEIPGVPFTGTTKSGTVNSTSDLDDVYSIKLLKGEKLQVNLTGATGTDFDIYLFNNSAKTVNNSAGMVAYSEKAGTSSETFTYYALEDGTYYLDVYAYKGSGSYTVTVKQGATAGIYENTAKEIGYFGTWQKSSTSSASGGNFAVANEAGAKAQFVFNGTGVTLKGVKSSLQGIVKITVDGVSTEVNMYSSSAIFKAQYFSKTGLKAGRHVVTIEWTGKVAKGGKKASTKVNLDTITVQ